LEPFYRHLPETFLHKNLQKFRNFVVGFTRLRVATHRNQTSNSIDEIHIENIPDHLKTNEISAALQYLFIEKRRHFSFFGPVLAGTLTASTS